MSEDMEKKRQLRTALLKKVYDLTKGSIATGVNGGEVAAQIGIKNGEEAQLRNAADYLEGEGLIKVTRVFGGFPVSSN